ncbi:MAG: glutamine-hydrolyzing carbamoyl-phosphate synthase small subunit [Pseudomonadota bacterium]
MRLCQDKPSVLPNARLVLADGSVFEGEGLGATGTAVGEVCFNTAMTGYQEILTDPSYAGQLITFTFPHIGNVGANDQDIENATDAAAVAARGAILRASVTSPSNYRARMDLDAWMRRRGIVGITGVDTRALTSLIRETGMPHGVVSHQPSGLFDITRLQEQASGFAGLEGKDLAKAVTDTSNYASAQGDWNGQGGFELGVQDGPRIVVIDFGVKRNILRRLVSVGAQVKVVPPTASYEEITAFAPEGVVLSNGPGDPMATGAYSVPVIKRLVEAKIPMLCICLGHQMLALALGAKTMKMPQGHHGANHPVQHLATGKVEIVSMNHGFAVDESTLPDGVEATYTSLFDKTNAGLRIVGAPVISVQHHPEASPGPQDSFGVFNEFLAMVREHKAA